jgi:hypothetical protein
MLTVVTRCIFEKGSENDREVRKTSSDVTRATGGASGVDPAARLARRHGPSKSINRKLVDAPRGLHGAP